MLKLYLKQCICCCVVLFCNLELSSAEMQAAVGNNYGKLQSAFDNFQQMFKKACQQKNIC